MTDNPFEKVLDRLREKGWKKGNLGGSDGPNCIAGAHLATARGNIGYSDWRKGIVPIISAQYPDRAVSKIGAIPNFNDHPDTTFADVERVLEKAAVKWEEDRVLCGGN